MYSSLTSVTYLLHLQTPGERYGVKCVNEFKINFQPTTISDVTSHLRVDAYSVNNMSRAISRNLKLGGYGQMFGGCRHARSEN